MGLQKEMGTRITFLFKKTFVGLFDAFQGYSQGKCYCSAESPSENKNKMTKKEENPVPQPMSSAELGEQIRQLESLVQRLREERQVRLREEKNRLEKNVED